MLRVDYYDPEWDADIPSGGCYTPDALTPDEAIKVATNHLLDNDLATQEEIDQEIAEGRYVVVEDLDVQKHMLIEIGKGVYV